MLDLSFYYQFEKDKDGRRSMSTVRMFAIKSSIELAIITSMATYFMFKAKKKVWGYCGLIIGIMQLLMISRTILYWYLYYMGKKILIKELIN